VRHELDSCIEKVVDSRIPLRVDLGALRLIDEAALASLMRLLGARRGRHLPVSFAGASPSLNRQLHWHGAAYLLDSAS